MCENEYDIWTAASVGDIEFIKKKKLVKLKMSIMQILVSGPV